MLDNPLVSVGLPTYNRPEGLERTIKYLLNQNYKNIEVIISDNCSTNSSVKEILIKYAAIDSRINYYIQNENIEIEPNFNFVYQKSKGKYFMWIADDDIFDTNYINTCINFLEENIDYVLCSGISNYYLDKKLLFREKRIILNQNCSLLRVLKYFLYVNKNGIFYGLYRNNLGFKYPIQKHIGGDWSHIARTALLGKIFVLDTININRSDDGGSSSRKKIASRWKVSTLTNIFLETYTAYEIARHIFNEPIIKRKYNLVFRLLIQFLIFIILNFKFLINSIRKRLYKLLP
ncbi:MAG: glycosyltransferase family 2 protein [Bacteroidetes bacterium]|nr:glycosyltransferase family 2 protein [Bacteroidota bacterium]MBK6820642.1 glycosyltransferase family 2 protein [Bacteroidota bacterium]MBK7040853.1 glycosyltransferase family 2 protein [Bacteroidota bacterium]MBK9299186.1 glycosyltransferase family 2 protein [Bacteroidota bacterium]